MFFSRSKTERQTQNRERAVIWWEPVLSPSGDNCPWPAWTSCAALNQGVFGGGGFLPLSALSSSNPIKVLLLWGLLVLHSASPSNPPQIQTCRQKPRSRMHSAVVHLLRAVQRVTSALTSNHRSGCWRPLPAPPGVWLPLTTRRA